ncbi:hypothetical protein QJS04_geneDACA011187 [Acorus gramineus]|uniref:Potassium channel domain-containing protein n=1 Tax=Acorus gramineus TaxID=55184 RepID=A0AAV9ALY1_ACOGR|nr:hypothetical protein QJS04_geneDACA011187 [Acorus gramineus]
MVAHISFSCPLNIFVSSQIEKFLRWAEWKIAGCFPSLAETGSQNIQRGWKMCIAGSVVFIVLASGFIGMLLLEERDWVDSIYFSFVGASTVGYGDITFHFIWGRLFACIWIFWGTTAFRHAVDSSVLDLLHSHLIHSYHLLFLYISFFHYGICYILQ